MTVLTFFMNWFCLVVFCFLYVFKQMVFSHTLVARTRYISGGAFGIVSLCGETQMRDDLIFMSMSFART